MKGLSDSELFDLKRSIGNNKSGFEPHLKPLQVSKVLQKALDCENTVKDIAKLINKRVNIIQKEERLRPPKSEVRRLVGSNLKLKNVTGWSPLNKNKKSLLIGLEKTIKWIENYKLENKNNEYTI